MKKDQVWTIVGISIVVALVVSILTTSITGNAIKVMSYRWGSEVYTKTEIDSMLKSSISYQGVLDMLTNSNVVNPYDRQGMSGVGAFLADGMSADQYCKNNGYGNCLMVLNTVDEVHFNSDDLSCTGGLNYDNRYINVNTPADCNTIFDDTFYNGMNFHPRTKSAECVGGGYGNSDHWYNNYVSFICAKPL
jgi:hypothetical protein